MKQTTITLLPLGEKGRDEGMSPPSVISEGAQTVRARARVRTMRALPSLILLAQPLTPAPLPQGERGAA